MKRVYLILGLLWLFGCQTTETPGKVYFAVILDNSWNDADSLTVTWVRQPGDTSLVHEGARAAGEDTVRILADEYAGGPTTLILRGFAQGGLIHYQVRQYDGSSRTVSLVEDKDLALPFLRIKAVAAQTIGDSVAFSALAEGRGKPLKAFAWDYQGDGRFDEAGLLLDTVAPLVGGYRYALAGEYLVKLRISDAWGMVIFDTLRISIRQDFPKANAGPDLGNRKLSQVSLRGQAEDTLGRIVKREWKIGNQGFQDADTLGQLTFTAPDSTGPIICVFRATDDDGQAAVDTLTLTLLAVSDPILSALRPNDTTVTIGDTLTWVTTGTPGTSGLATMAWDLGTGTFGTPQPVAAGVRVFKQGLRFPVPKEITVRARLEDSVGRIANAASAHVKVVIDSPKVYAGVDTIVPVGGVIRLRGQASDDLGDIVRTEWRIGGIYRLASPDTQFAAATPGTFDYVLRAIDDDGLFAIDSVRVTVSPSTSAALSELSLVGIDFDTAFRANRYIYSASVANSVTSVKVNASVASNSKATLKVKGTPLTSGNTTAAINLNVGVNLLDVVVTAQDTNIHQNYLISVTRAANSSALLQSLLTSLGPVSPSFRDTIYNYTVQAPYRTNSVTISVAAQATTTKLTLNGNAFAKNTATDSIVLTGATTQIRVISLAEAGNTLTYTLTVQRDTASDEIVSDFEKRSTLNSLGGYWSFVDDSQGGGNSRVLSGDTTTRPTTITASSWGVGNAGTTGALLLNFRFGNVNPTCGTGCTFGNYVGYYTPLKPIADSVVNLTGATAFTFYAKADTNLNLRFIVQTNNILSEAYYQSMVSITTEWKKFTVYLRVGVNPGEFAQPAWSTDPMPFSLNRVTGLFLQLSKEDNAAVTRSNMLIDDLTILGWRKP